MEKHKGTVRKSRRLAKKRRSKEERKAGRMSVGEALGVASPGKHAVNLAEARALESAKAAAAQRHGNGASVSHSKKKQRSKKKSAKKGRGDEAADATQRKDWSSERREARRRSSLALGKLTARLFDEEEHEKDGHADDAPNASDDLADMPELESGDDDSWGECKDRGAADSVIETPASQRAEPRPSDAAFIKGSAEETSADVPPTTGDEDYVPSEPAESEDSDFHDRLALVVRRSVEEVAEPGEADHKPSEGEESDGSAPAHHLVSNSDEDWDTSDDEAMPAPAPRKEPSKAGKIIKEVRRKREAAERERRACEGQPNGNARRPNALRLSAAGTMISPLNRSAPVT